MTSWADRVARDMVSTRDRRASDEPGHRTDWATEESRESPPVVPATGRASVEEHLPQRPSWDCASCGRPWPCDPAREQLAGEMGRTQLRIYGWLQLEQAAVDLRGVGPAELYERFLGWPGEVPVRSAPELHTRGPGQFRAADRAGR